MVVVVVVMRMVMVMMWMVVMMPRCYWWILSRSANALGVGNVGGDRCPTLLDLTMVMAAFR